jgi:hypothetical protein
MDKHDSVPSLVVDDDDEPMVNGTRRSARATRAPRKYEEKHPVPQEKPSQTTPTQAKDTAQSQRPKRRAAEAAEEQITSEDVSSLHEMLFARMDDDERKEYKGWVELESEPVSSQPFQ